MPEQVKWIHEGVSRGEDDAIGAVVEPIDDGYPGAGFGPTAAVVALGLVLGLWLRGRA